MNGIILHLRLADRIQARNIGGSQTNLNIQMFECVNPRGEFIFIPPLCPNFLNLRQILSSDGLFNSLLRTTHPPFENPVSTPDSVFSP